MTARCRPVVIYPPTDRSRVLTAVRRVQYQQPSAVDQRGILAAPILYVLNAASLAKPNAVIHLATDLKNTGASVAVITETHLKQKHTDNVVGIDGYCMHRRDMTGRRGGGVALYVQLTFQSSVWTPSSVGNHAFELLWVRVGGSMFVAALYHPPRSTYDAADLLSQLESCVAEINHDYPAAEIIVAGDLNQLRDDDVVELTGLTQIVRQPTRGSNILDRVIVSNPQLYNTVRVVSSVVKSDHKTVVATSSDAAMSIAKTRQKRTYRPRTPTQNASFLRHLAATDLTSRPP